ncbi:Ligand binding domain of hormone receptors protein [Tyrophagus putrescentiae]|nr:Ligand binding domain of hormone receptors protein [Tyrophagus putrescentiae]
MQGKIFFRRNAAHPEKLRCRKTGNCQIDFATRKCCPACRLKKCFSIGMDLKKPKSRNRKKKLKTADQNSAQTTTTISINKIQPNNDNKSDNVNNELNIRQVLLEPEEVNENQSYDVQPTPSKYFHKKYSNKLNEYELNLISQIKSAMKVFEDENLLPVVGTATHVKDVFNLAGLYARRIVRLCKSIPAFKVLENTQKLYILKAFYFDITAIRMAYLFDKNKDGFNFIFNEDGTSAMFVPIDLCNQFSNKELSKTHRLFAMQLNAELENDKTVFNLIIAQAMFKPQDVLSCPEFIRYHYFVYSRLLEKYLSNKYKCNEKAKAKYDRLMDILAYLPVMHENLNRAILELDLSQLTEVVYDVMNIANNAQ